MLFLSTEDVRSMNCQYYWLVKQYKFQCILTIDPYYLCIELKWSGNFSFFLWENILSIFFSFRFSTPRRAATPFRILHLKTNSSFSHSTRFHTNNIFIQPHEWTIRFGKMHNTNGDAKENDFSFVAMKVEKEELTNGLYAVNSTPTG